MTALKQLQLRPYWAFSAISDDQLRASGNNFTGARMLLASLVIWTHCYWRSTGLTGADEVSTMVGLPLSHLAVNGFFFVSGFLICQSLFRQPGFGSFSLMRVARIWPALIVCTVLTVGVFALLSDRPMAYVSAEQSLRFAAMNLTMIKAAYELPAVASGNVNLAIVNGSLWTIPWELRCYLAIGLGFAIAAPRRRAWVEPVLAFSVAAAIIWAVAQQYWSDFPPTYQGLLFNLDIWMRLWGCFAAGALIWLWRQAAMPSPWLATALAAVAIAEYNLVGSALLATPAVIAWLLIAVFSGGAARALTAQWPDLSYGIYIFAFPVMELLALLWPSLLADHRLLAVANLASVLPIAAISWFMIEKPALAGARLGLLRARERKSRKT